MAVKTRAQLKSENASDFPDNAARLISPADLRGQMDDVVDSALFPEDGVVAAAPGDVNGMTALRGLSPVSGGVIHLNYHTTVGDLGAGNFYGVTGAAPGTYTDNGGTVIVPTGGDGSAAWLRVWDHIKAHVGWFGAKCDPQNLATDDYLPVKKCFDLFTNGRTTGGGPGGGTIHGGIIDVGPGFCFSQPLIYGGATTASFKLVGTQSLGRSGLEKSLLQYTGPATLASIIFYGASEWTIEDINPWPNLALNGVLVTADNTYNSVYAHTTTAPITAGANVVVTPAGGPAIADRILWLQPGVMLGVDYGFNHNGTGSADNFEIVYITAVDTVAGTFTADFKKDHASGVLLGGGSPSSGGHVNRCRFVCPASPVWTTLTANSTGPVEDTVFVVADITGIKVGHPIRVGSLITAEILYPKTVNIGANSFTAEAHQLHVLGELVMYPTAGITYGNRLLGTVQVDNVVTSESWFVGGGGVLPSKSYAGMRQIWGGNVKNYQFNNCFANSVRVAFAFEQSSAQYIFNGGASAGVEELLWYCASVLTVSGWEDESYAMWLIGNSGANASHATFIGCTMQGAAPRQPPDPNAIVGATDEMFFFGGNLTFIGCGIRNNRIYDETLPLIVVQGLLADTSPSFAGTLSLIGCCIDYARLDNMNFVRTQPSGTLDVLKDGTGKVTMLNCMGGSGGAMVRLPDILPSQRMWQGTATYDPASIAAGAVGAAQTMTVSGAALGDLVEASFSLDLQGVGINAWVSATDTVKYQFRNPTAAPLDLGSGTVKCRVKK